MNDFDSETNVERFEGDPLRLETNGSHREQRNALRLGTIGSYQEQNALD